MPIGKRLSALEPHKCMRTFFSSHGILAIQRSASCHVIVFWLFCTAAGLLLPPPSHARTCIASVADKNNLFHFLTSLVEGLGYAQISIQRYSGKTQGSPMNSSLFSMLSVIKLAKEDLECRISARWVPREFTCIYTTECRSCGIVICTTVQSAWANYFRFPGSHRLRT